MAGEVGGEREGGEGGKAGWNGCGLLEVMAGGQGERRGSDEESESEEDNGREEDLEVGSNDKGGGREGRKRWSARVFLPLPSPAPPKGRFAHLTTPKQPSRYLP